MNDLMKIGKHFEFEASHILPKHPGKCGRMHGHSYKLTIIIEGAIDKHTGMVMDFASLSDMVKEEIISKYDHRHMNDFFENPTAEIMANAFFNVISEKLAIKTNGSVKLDSLRLYETSNSFVEVSEKDT